MCHWLFHSRPYYLTIYVNNFGSSRDVYHHINSFAIICVREFYIPRKLYSECNLSAIDLITTMEFSITITLPYICSITNTIILKCFSFNSLFEQLRDALVGIIFQLLRECNLYYVLIIRL